MNKQIFVAKKSFFLSNCSSAWQVSLEISGGTARDYFALRAIILRCVRLFALRAIILRFARLFALRAIICTSCDYLRFARLFCAACDYLHFARLFALRAVWPCLSRWRCGSWPCHSRWRCVISWTTWRARSQPSPFADGVAAGRVLVAGGVAAGRVIVAVGV